ncbi:nuclear transport factor 2 family protein [Corallibacter sp.]|uniref:nuclear transport factor 2 family protein n=1 Tax=Corallibacter sp. TaxID=2038084 RepID=UPI003A8DB3DF
MDSKSVVQNYYNSNIEEITGNLNTFFHEDCCLHWNSSKGFLVLGFKELETFFNDLSSSYKQIRTEISHLLQEDNFVTTRYTTYGNTIENEDEEIALAHYMSIWEVKEGKLYKGYEISQLADDYALKINSFAEIKI